MLNFLFGGEGLGSTGLVGVPYALCEILVSKHLFSKVAEPPQPQQESSCGTQNVVDLDFVKPLHRSIPHPQKASDLSWVLSRGGARTVRAYIYIYMHACHDDVQRVGHRERVLRFMCRELREASDAIASRRVSSDAAFRTTFSRVWRFTLFAFASVIFTWLKYACVSLILTQGRC